MATPGQTTAWGRCADCGEAGLAFVWQWRESEFQTCGFCVGRLQAPEWLRGDVPEDRLDGAVGVPATIVSQSRPPETQT